MSKPPFPGPGRVDPRNLQAIFNQALAAHRAGQLDLAASLYRQILSHSKKQFAPLHLLGVIEGQRGNLAEGIRQISKAIKLDPNSADAYLNLGRMQGELGEFANAERSLRKALALNPASTLAAGNLAAVLRRLERFEEALACVDAVLAREPNNAIAIINRANILFDLERFGEARPAYERALGINQDDAEAWLGLGVTENRLKNPEGAVAALKRAAALKPASPDPWLSLGHAFETMGRHEDTAAVVERALSLNPQATLASGMLAFAKASLCDWSRIAEEREACLAGIRRGDLAAVPFAGLLVTDDPAAQLKCATLYAQAVATRRPEPLWRGERYRHDRIRVAYLSGDFRDHPVTHLIAAAFEQHDQSRFETFGISTSPSDSSAEHRRVSAALTHFHDVHDKPDAEIAALLRNLEIDIVIDLIGYTQGTRPGILVRRPVPVQVNYLGYPGTMGTSHHDYIIADPTVIPTEAQQFYSEQVVHLPDCYLPNDRARTIAEHTPSRAEEGLPAEGFVFCGFNNPFKFSPEAFDIWMRLLGQIEGSVLWLRNIKGKAADNLRREAEKRGIAGERIVFARRAERMEDHLARHRLADLFLDTPHYNAHASACDALWAGLPLITCVGAAFAGRVGASVLRAAGLPELVTTSLADYEALALRLAREPDTLAAIKARVAGQRLTAPLFDTARFTRHLEAAYATMWQRYQNGEPPQAFAVERLG
jgi:predicted O-linked N-acetylglucosamine transferase (SPINDLY family)